MTIKQAVVFAAPLLLTTCAQGPDPHRIGVFADTDAGIIELPVYGTEEEDSDSRAEGVAVRFVFPKGQALPKAAGLVMLYINLPDAVISDSKLFSLPTLDARWHLRSHTELDPQPVRTAISKTDTGSYRMTSNQLHAKTSGYAALFIRMPRGVPDRLYAVQLSGR